MSLLEFLLSAFFCRKHFSPFPGTWRRAAVCCAVAHHLDHSPFHFLRSPVEAPGEQVAPLGEFEPAGGRLARPGPGGHRRRSSQTLGAGAGLSGRSDLNGEEAKNPPKRGQKGQKGVGRWEGGRMKVPGACCWLLGLVCLSQVRGFFVIGWQMLFSVKRQRVFHTICERG